MSPVDPTDARERSELEVRWRQARNAPPPIVRAIVAAVGVAGAGGVVLLAWDLASGGAGLGAFALCVVVVVAAGSLLTYLWAPLPSGASGERRRSPWAAAFTQAWSASGAVRRRPWAWKSLS